MTRALVLALLVAIVCCPGALAHGGGRPGYISTVKSVAPAVAGVTLAVLEGDDRLQLTNSSPNEVVVLGYDGEPYLRFTTDGVYRNRHSPATYLNEDRYGAAKIPAAANSDSEPDWELVTHTNRYDWHDHRIHWMSPIDPPQVRAAPDERHHLFDWEVPGRYDSKTFTIAGSLDYTPVGSSRPHWVVLASPFAALLFAAGIWMRVRTRRARRSERPTQ